MRLFVAFLLIVVALAEFVRPSISADSSMIVYVPAAFTARDASCDNAYPTVCIQSPPPDLNCEDVLPHKDFQVLPPDPHGFDRDNDGIGCESR